MVHVAGASREPEHFSTDPNPFPCSQNVFTPFTVHSVLGVVCTRCLSVTCVQNDTVTITLRFEFSTLCNRRPPLSSAIPTFIKLHTIPIMHRRICAFNRPQSQRHRLYVYRRRPLQLLRTDLEVADAPTKDVVLLHRKKHLKYI